MPMYIHLQYKYRFLLTLHRPNALPTGICTTPRTAHCPKYQTPLSRGMEWNYTSGNGRHPVAPLRTKYKIKMIGCNK